VFLILVVGTVDSKFKLLYDVLRLSRNSFDILSLIQQTRRSCRTSYLCGGENVSG